MQSALTYTRLRGVLQSGVENVSEENVIAYPSYAVLK